MLSGTAFTAMLRPTDSELGDILRAHMHPAERAPPAPAFHSGTQTTADTVPAPTPAQVSAALPTAQTFTPPATQVVTTPQEVAAPTAPDDQASTQENPVPTVPVAHVVQAEEGAAGGASPSDTPANDSSWSARNPTQSDIPVRQLEVKKLTDEEKAKRSMTRQNTLAKRQALEDAVKNHVMDNNTRIEALAQQHHVSVKYVTNLCTSPSTYHKSRKPQLKNALVHAKAKEVNKERAPGERFSLAEINEMVKGDPGMQNLSPEEEQEYLTALAEWRDTKMHGVRANKAAAAQDVSSTTHRIKRELDSLRDRTGIQASLFVTRGHVDDTMKTTWYGTDNSDAFWEDVIKCSPAEVARKYEQWACTQGKNLEERDSLSVVRKQVTAEIIKGLKNATGKSNIVMNYTHYETSIVATYGVKLVGWPACVSFTNPSNIGTVWEIRRLRDDLRSGACHWKKLSKSEREEHTNNLNERRQAGEQVKPPRKKRSDAGQSRKRSSAAEAEEGNSGRKRQREDKDGASRNTLRAVVRSQEFIDDESDQQDEQ